MRRLIGFGAATHPGEWPAQEDAYWIDPVRGLFALADGFGGLGAGDRAAALAVEAFAEAIGNEQIDSSEANSPLSPEEIRLVQALRAANKAVDDFNHDRSHDARAGVSMLASMVLPAGRLVIASIGHAGAAILRRGKVVAHFPAQSFAASQGGVLGAKHPRFGLDFPLQFLGQGFPIEPFTRTYFAQSDDQLILFTEGFVAGGIEVLSQAALFLEADRESRTGAEAPGERYELMAKELLELSRTAQAKPRNHSVILVDLGA